MVTNPNVQALIFDIGQVIVRVRPRRAASVLARGSAIGAERLLRIVQQSVPLKDFQEGRLSAKEWYRCLCALLGLRVTYREFRAAWNLALDSQPILDEALFANLAKRYRLVLLSNTDPIHVAHMHKTFRFPRYFPYRVYSCAMGASKPDPAIYREAIRCAGVAAAHILYVDDVPEYVAGGRKAGLQTFQFESRRQLLAELRRRSILKR